MALREWLRLVVPSKLYLWTITCINIIYKIVACMIRPYDWRMDHQLTGAQHWRQYQPMLVVMFFEWQAMHHSQVHLLPYQSLRYWLWVLCTITRTIHTYLHITWGQTALIRTLHTAGIMVKLLTQPIKACFDALYASNSGLYIRMLKPCVTVSFHADEHTRHGNLPPTMCIQWHHHRALPNVTMQPWSLSWLQ